MDLRGRSQGVSVVVGLAAVCACLSCGGSQTPTGMAPSPTAPAPGSSATATITGTVLGVSSTTRVQPRGAALTVTVTGSSASASVDDSGHFTLVNVPPGHVDLHFMGNGVDAHLALDVAEHATLVIVVRVGGNDAHLEDDHDAPAQPAEVSGVIAAGSIAGACAAHTLSFIVAGTKVSTNASTQFSDGTCEALEAGSRVEVKGARQSDGSVLAATIETDGDAEQQELEVAGIIAGGSIAGACATNSLSFIVADTAVRTNASTEFKDTSCASLKAGDRVEVHGVRQPDSAVLASRVERKN